MSSDRATDDWRLPRLNPTGDISQLWQFHLPHFASFFRKIDTPIADGPFYMASIPGEAKDPIQRHMPDRGQIYP